MNVRACLRATPLVLWWHSACTAVDPGEDYRHAGAQIRQATGSAGVYQPQDEAAGAARVAELLAGGITAAEALEITLWNNPEIQAAFFRIGVGRADLVQAGLYSNPSLGAVFRFPSGGGLAGLDLGLAQSIADLWQVPAREAAAAEDLERVVLDVARRASELGLEAQSAYYAACAADQDVEVARQNERTAQELLDLVLARQEAGAGTELDTNAARSDQLEHALALKEARLVALEARARLARLLGLDRDPSTLELVDGLPQAPPDLPPLDRMLAAAQEARLDLRAGRHLVDAQAARLGLERRARFGDVVVGAEYEREARPGGEPREASLGPALEWELPLFDQNQAQVARAALLHQQALRLLEGLTLSVRQEVRAAADRVQAAWEMADFYRTDLLPGQQATLDLAREAYQLGKTSFLSVLEAQRALLNARRRALHAQEVAAQATMELQRALGGPLPAPVDPTTSSNPEGGA